MMYREVGGQIARQERTGFLKEKCVGRNINSVIHPVDKAEDLRLQSSDTVVTFLPFTEDVDEQIPRTFMRKAASFGMVLGRV